jgi:hypothetical protein
MYLILFHLLIIDSKYILLTSDQQSQGSLENSNLLSISWDLHYKKMFWLLKFRQYLVTYKQMVKSDRVKFFGHCPTYSNIQCMPIE